MREVRCAVKRIDIPPIVAALIVQPLLFPKNVMRRPFLLDALAYQRLGCTIRRRHQIGVALIFNLEMLMKIFHQERACFARNLRHLRNKAMGGWIGH